MPTETPQTNPLLTRETHKAKNPKTIIAVTLLALTAISLLIAAAYPKNKPIPKATSTTPAPNTNQSTPTDTPPISNELFSTELLQIDKDLQTKQDFPPPQIDINIGL